MLIYTSCLTLPISHGWPIVEVYGGGRRPKRLHTIIMNDDSDEYLAIEPKNSTPEQRREFGSYVRVARAIHEATTEAIATIARSRVHEFIPEENTRRFMHGTGWSSPASSDDAPEEMVLIKDVFVVEWANVADHDLSIVTGSIMGIANSMADQQIKNIFQSVAMACNRSGNVVDGVQRSIPDAFMEMFEKIEFGVGADGAVSMPSIYVGPDMADRILDELQSQPPEFQARAEALIERKKAAAMANEQARLNRFRTAVE